MLGGCSVVAANDSRMSTPFYSLGQEVVEESYELQAVAGHAGSQEDGCQAVRVHVAGTGQCVVQCPNLWGSHHQFQLILGASVDRHFCGNQSRLQGVGKMTNSVTYERVHGVLCKAGQELRERVRKKKAQKEV